MINEVEKAYIAGFVDADGSICMGKQTHSIGFRPKIAIYNRDESVLRWIMYVTECGFGYHSRIKKPKWREMNHIYISSRKNCKAFLESILPYLQVKKAQGELLLEYCTNHQHGVLTERDVEIYKTLQTLNSRGVYVQV